jgi:hypothetical protein
LLVAFLCEEDHDIKKNPSSSSVGSRKVQKDKLYNVSPIHRVLQKESWKGRALSYTLERRNVYGN